MALLACSPPKDDVIFVADDDPDMIAAISAARTSLPEFWQHFEKPERGETDFSLKVKITDGDDVEYSWLTDLDRNNGKLMGTVGNDPQLVANVKYGDRIEIPQADITDWLYMRDGKIVGNRTVRALFKGMSVEEVEQTKKMLADP
jgi:uncharacterized protein YegJ (DUF2314 family)